MVISRIQVVPNTYIIQVFHPQVFFYIKSVLFFVDNDIRSEKLIMLVFI